jgi:hypothetical protein
MLVSMVTPLRFTTYRKLKDKLIGLIGSAERTQFEQELRSWLSLLPSHHGSTEHPARKGASLFRGLLPLTP